MADQRGGDDDRRERYIQCEDRHEGRRGDACHPAVRDRPAADAPRRMQHDRGHCRLDAVEQPGDHGLFAAAHVDPGQRDQQQQRRQDEQRTGDDAAPGPVQQPADVGRQLLGLWPRQHHAVVERVQEPLLADPAAALDQFGMHQRDLARRATETDEAELEPEAERLGERHLRGCLHRCLRRCHWPAEGAVSA